MSGSDLLANLDEHALWLAAIVAGLTALGWLARKGLRAARWLRRQTREWAARFDALEGLVHHELNSNSGSSVKDSLERIESRVNDVDKRVAGVDGRALLTAGMLAQHVDESRAYLGAALATFAEHGITLPSVPPPHPTDEEPHDG